MGIAQINVISFFPSEFFFPGRFYTCLSRIVAGTIFTGMAFYVGLVDFRHVAEKVTSGIDRIISNASDLSLESLELVLDFGELHVGFRRYLLEHHHGLVSDSFAVLAVFRHFSAQELRRDVQGICEQ